MARCLPRPPLWWEPGRAIAPSYSRAPRHSSRLCTIVVRWGPPADALGVALGLGPRARSPPLAPSAPLGGGGELGGWFPAPPPPRTPRLPDQRGAEGRAGGCARPIVRPRNAAVAPRTLRFCPRPNGRTENQLVQACRPRGRVVNVVVAQQPARHGPRTPGRAASAAFRERPTRLLCDPLVAPRPFGRSKYPLTLRPPTLRLTITGASLCACFPVALQSVSAHIVPCVPVHVSRCIRLFSEIYWIIALRLRSVVPVPRF